jgi:hypothetical protein
MSLIQLLDTDSVARQPAHPKPLGHSPTRRSRRFRRVGECTGLIVASLFVSGCGSSDSKSVGGQSTEQPAVGTNTESTDTTLATATAAVPQGSVDCASLRLREFNQAFGFAAAPGGVFLIGTKEIKASVAELPAMVKALRALEPFEQKVGSLPPLKEALDRIQQRADAAAAALDGQDTTLKAFNAVEADLRNQLTLDIAALGSAITKAGCPQ